MIELSFLNELLQASQQDYDIYLYDSKVHDLEWLSHVSNLSDTVLIDNSSSVTVQQNSSLVRFGKDQTYLSPTDYFTKMVE